MNALLPVLLVLADLVVVLSATLDGDGRGVGVTLGEDEWCPTCRHPVPVWLRPDLAVTRPVSQAATRTRPPRRRL